MGVRIRGSWRRVMCFGCRICEWEEGIVGVFPGFGEAKDHRMGTVVASTLCVRIWLLFFLLMIFAF